MRPSPPNQTPSSPSSPSSPSPNASQGGVTLSPEVHAGGPMAVYEGYVKMRVALRDQLQRLEEQRGELTGQLRDEPISAANVRGLEQRIAQVDVRIAAIDGQLAEVDAAIARASALPGVEVTEPPR